MMSVISGHEVIAFGKLKNGDSFFNLQFIPFMLNSLPPGHCF